MAGGRLYVAGINGLVYRSSELFAVTFDKAGNLLIHGEVGSRGVLESLDPILGDWTFVQEMTLETNPQPVQLDLSNSSSRFFRFRALSEE